MSKDEARKTEALMRKLATRDDRAHHRARHGDGHGASPTRSPCCTRAGAGDRDAGRDPAQSARSRKPTSAATPKRSSRTDELRAVAHDRRDRDPDAPAGRPRSTPTTARATCCATSRCTSAPARPSRCLGRNGVGKTTTLKSIVGWLQAAQRQRHARRQELVGRDMMTIARTGVSLVPEERRIFTNLTVAENLKIAQVTAQQAGLDARPRLREVPAPARAADPQGRRDQRRREADARHRPRAAAGRQGAAARRADRRTRAR